MVTTMMNEMEQILDTLGMVELVSAILAPDESDLDYLRAIEEELVLVADLDAADGEWDEADTDEFYAWLDSLAPSIEECEWRDAFLGHDA